MNNTSRVFVSATIICGLLMSGWYRWIILVIGWLVAASPPIILILAAIYARRATVLIGTAVMFLAYMIFADWFLFTMVGIGSATSPSSQWKYNVVMGIAGGLAVVWIIYLAYLPDALKRGRKFMKARRHDEKARAELGKS